MGLKRQNLTQVAVSAAAHVEPPSQEKTPRRVGLGVDSFYESSEE